MHPLSGTPSTGGIVTSCSITQIPNAQQTSTLKEWMDNQLLQVIRRLFHTKYASQSPSLSAFRETVLVHGGIEFANATLLADFRARVPLSDYDSYKPFADRFNIQPCRKDDVENLFSPGLPEFLGISSSTSGRAPKLLARYADPRGGPLPSPFFDPNSKTPLASLVYCGSVDVKEIVDQSGRVVNKVPVCLASGQMVRRLLRWEYADDERRLSTTLPYYAVPWAAATVSHFPSFLTIHGLFFLTHRDIDRFHVPFATLFVDLIRDIDEHWDMLVSSIRDGILPDLEGIDQVREHLQKQLYADPERATELLEIGPPSSIEGWFTRVWPNIRELRTVCSGPWTMMLPKVRSISGPNILVTSPGYGTSESKIGSLHDRNKPDEFVLSNDKVIEFLDVSQGDAIENIHQAWEVEVGKQYEPVITTLHGLWRYQMGDIVTIVGFHLEKHSPIFKFLGRKSMKIRLPHMQIADFHLLEAIRVSNSEDTIIVQEYTTLVDNRTSPPTVGYVVELMKSPGENAYLTPQRVFNTLVATDIRHRHALERGQIRLPTIRVVKPGTFSEYRFQRAKAMKISSGQIKLPSVLEDPNVQEWILERVVQEL